MVDVHFHITLTDAQFSLLLVNATEATRIRVQQASRLIDREMSARLRNALRPVYNTDESILELISHGTSAMDGKLFLLKNFGRASLKEFYAVFADLLVQKAVCE